jgi:hypothetical protein
VSGDLWGVGRPLGCRETFGVSGDLWGVGRPLLKTALRLDVAYIMKCIHMSLMTVQVLYRFNEIIKRLDDS